MATKKKTSASTAPTAAKKSDTSAADARRRQNRMIAVAGVAIVAVLAVGLAWAVFLRPSGSTVTAGAGGAAMAAQGTVVQGTGGTWTNVDAELLASMLQKKDFTFLNVKTPYIGEIEGTDLYIPYDQVAARAADLPADKAAPIVVYCRTGRESAIAAQTLLDLGYTDVINLEGGMTAWTASGRTLVNGAGG
jgi:rhodanese-related sulfurtransferase